MDEVQAPVIREDVKFVGEPAELAALFLALAKAQGEFMPVLKDSTAKVAMKAGGQYTFDYAGLDVVIAATQPALTKYELALIQLPVEEGNALLTVLAHGPARIESTSPMFPWSGPQEYGSAVTYAKRYARVSLLSVFPSGEDDDGAKAGGHKATITPRQAPPQVAARPAPKEAPGPAQGAITTETKARVKELAQQAGMTMAELEAFSLKNSLGALGGLSELNGLVLVSKLEGLKVQP